MNHSPSRIVIQLLVDLGESSLDQAANWSAQINNITYDTKPPNKIGVYTTFVRSFGDVLETGQSVNSKGIQIVTRGVDDAAAYDKIVKILEKLESIKNRNVSIDNKVYNVKSFSLENGPFFLKQEEKDLRRFYALNGFINYGEIQ